MGLGLHVGLGLVAKATTARIKARVTCGTRAITARIKARVTCGTRASG